MGHPSGTCPDQQSPDDSLARVLEEGGLELHGVELVFATRSP